MYSTQNQTLFTKKIKYLQGKANTYNCIWATKCIMHRETQVPLGNAETLVIINFYADEIMILSPKNQIVTCCKK